MTGVAGGRWARGVRLLALIALGLAITGVWGSHRNDLSRHLSQLRPGMSHGEIDRLIPARLLRLDSEPATLPSAGTWLAAPGAKCAWRRSYASSGLFGSVEYAELYFDASNRLVGLRYASSGAGPWRPSWGGAK